jgi:hypothetical protein
MLKWRSSAELSGDEQAASQAAVTDCQLHVVQCTMGCKIHRTKVLCAVVKFFQGKEN